MYLKKMRLYHFRNFDNTIIDFHDGVNIIVGPNNSNIVVNAAGSTPLLPPIPG